MTRNKYGVHQSMIRKADSMRNPEYIKLPKGSMTSRAKRNDILQLMNDISYSASPYGRSADMLQDFMQRLKRPSNTKKRMSSVYKSDSMRNPEYVNIKRAPAKERLTDKLRARLNIAIGNAKDKIEDYQRNNKKGYIPIDVINSGMSVEDYKKIINLYPSGKIPISHINRMNDWKSLKNQEQQKKQQEKKDLATSAYGQIARDYNRKAPEYTKLPKRSMISSKRPEYVDLPRGSMRNASPEYIQEKRNSESTTKRMSSVRKSSTVSDSMRNPAYINLPKGSMMSSSTSSANTQNTTQPSSLSFDWMGFGNRISEDMNNAKLFLTDKDARAGFIGNWKAQAMDENSNTNNVKSFLPSHKADQLPQQYKNDIYNKYPPTLTPTSTPTPSPSPSTIGKRMKSSVRKASSDSMRNPKYLTMGRSPAEETIGMKARARVNRAVGNPLETVITMLQGKDVRNNVKATQNTNRRMARMAEEMSLRNDRKNRVPEYTRLPKSNTLDMGRKVIATVNRLRSLAPDPVEQVLSVLKSPAVIARMALDKQFGNKGFK